METTMRKPNDTEKPRELTEDELNHVSGGKQKPDGTAGGNVAAKWSVAQGAVA
jgi:bacteriocin-like protein